MLLSPLIIASGMEHLQPTLNFHALSIKDLQEARYQYHVELTTKLNVVATALSLYRFKRNVNDKEKTFGNTTIRKDSYPCILVFVKRYEDLSAFQGDKAAHLVPPFLHLSDGRIIPTCVIKAELDTSPIPQLHKLPFSKGVLGGGFPLIVEVQGQEHVGSIGCLVTDGHLLYALTNLHIAGAEKGTPVYSIIDGHRVQIGKTSNKNIRHRQFTEVYPQWPARETFITMDIGLIEVLNKEGWTTNINGLGPVGQLVDLNSQNFSMNLIGTPVKAYGCASGLMKGKIMALFYRYKAACGKQYVADFLIGREGRSDEARFTQPGDSGTVWHVDIDADVRGKTTPVDELTWELRHEEGYRNMPIAVQWGGHSILSHGPSGGMGGSSRSASSVYALASSLSSALDILDVELVVDWQSYLYWGDVGHYLVAYKAIGIVQDPTLKQILTDHISAITFSEAAVAKGKGSVMVPSGQYVPLADVPDLAWKTPQRKPREGPNHHVAIDRISPNGLTMIHMIKDDPSIVTDANRWIQYYHGVATSDMGLLHFRVWQLYDLLVSYIKEGDVPRFIATAGILSHYLGDACQPLHASGHFDGEKQAAGPKKGKGVHSKFESQMVAAHSATLLGYVDQCIEGMDKAATPIVGGKHAARATMDLILRTYSKIPPLVLTDTYATGGADEVWNQYGELTGEVMADGCAVLANMWDSAWQEGIGKKNVTYVGPVEKEAFWRLYSDDAFLPSYTLDHITSQLKDHPAVGQPPCTTNVK